MTELHPGWVNGIDTFEARLATGVLVSSAGGLGDQLDPIRARQGLRDAPNFPGQVTLGTNQLTVNPFQAVIVDEAKPTAGSYLVTMDAPKDLPLVADQTYPRIDRVVAIVDPATEPGLSVQLVEGNPAASPQPPAIPGSAWLEIAQITVPPVGKGAPVVADRRRFTAALGGIIPVPSADDLPAGAADSQFAYRLDTGTLMVHRQGQWTVYRPPAVQNPWLALPVGDGWRPNYGSRFPAAYQRGDDGWVRLRGMVSRSDTDTTKPICTLPEGYRPPIDHVFGVMTGAGTIGPLQVTPTGLVTEAKAGTSHLSNVWTSLEGVAFTTY